MENAPVLRTCCGWPRTAQPRSGPPLTGQAEDVCLPLGAQAATTELFAADVVSGPYTVQAGATVNAAAKTVTLPLPTRTKFLRLRGGSAVTIGKVAIQGGNLVLTYQ